MMMHLKVDFADAATKTQAVDHQDVQAEGRENI